MAKSLSANITTGKGGGGYKIYYLLEFYGRRISDGWIMPFQTATVPSSSIPNWTGTSFPGGLLLKEGLGDISQAVDIEDGGNKAFISDFTVIIANANECYKYAFALYDFENQSLELRLIFAGPGLTSGTSQPSWANALPLFKGQIKEISWDYEKIIIQAIDVTLSIHREIPQKKINKVDFPQCDDSLIDTPVPILYGAFGITELEHKNCIPYITQQLGIYPQWHDIVGHPSDFAKLIKVENMNEMIGGINRNINKYLICGHDIFRINTPFNEHNKYPALYDSILKGYFKNIQTLIDEQYYNGEYFILRYYNEYYVQEKCIIPKLYNVDNYNAVDEDPYNYTITNTYIRCKFDKDFAITNSMMNNGWIYFIFQALCTNPWTNIIVNVYYNDILERIWTPLIWFPGYQGQYSIPLFVGIGPPAVFENLNKLMIDIDYGTLNSSGFLQVYNIAVHTWTEIPDTNFENLYLPAGGRMCGENGDWGASNISTSQMIENPAHIIESILRDECAQISANINRSSIDLIAGSHRAGWKFANQILDTEMSDEIITKICNESGMIYMNDYQGLHKLKAIRNINPPSSTTLQNIYMTVEGETGDKNFSYKIYKQMLEKVYNEFYLNYKKNLASGEYEKHLYCKNPQNASWSPEYCNLDQILSGVSAQTYWNKCHSIWVNYNHHKQTLTIDADWIRDDWTANKMLQWLIDWFAYRKHIIEFEGGLSYISIEIGDQYRISHPINPMALATTSFMCIEMGIKPEQDKIAFKFIEIPDGLI